MSFIVNTVLLVLVIGFPAVVGAVMGRLYGGANETLVATLLGGAVQFGILWLAGHLGKERR